MDARNTVCFSGYRPDKFPFIFQSDTPAYIALQEQLLSEILKSLQSGYINFMCGMAKGFDLMAAEVVLELVDSSPDSEDVGLICVLPFGGHGFTDSWQAIHQRALSRAKEIITLEPTYSRAAYHQRNRYMVDHSSRLICYHDGQKGGTEMTINYARQKGLEIINLAVEA